MASLVELGLGTYFILKPNRFLTSTVSFSGTSSTVHNSLKIMFQNFTSWCYPGYMIHAYRVVYSVSEIKSYFSCSKNPKVRVNYSSEFF